MIALTNGATILKVTLDLTPVAPRGVALCSWHDDYVVWNVYRSPDWDDSQWHCEIGDYFTHAIDQAFEKAVTRYRERAQHV